MIQWKLHDCSIVIKQKMTFLITSAKFLVEDKNWSHCESKLVGIYLPVGDSFFSIPKEINECVEFSSLVEKVFFQQKFIGLKNQLETVPCFCIFDKTQMQNSHKLITTKDFLKISEQIYHKVNSKSETQSENRIEQFKKIKKEFDEIKKLFVDFSKRTLIDLDDFLKIFIIIDEMMN
jgi:hypothetical protein